MIIIEMRGEFVYAASDAGLKITRDGAIYDEAYDPMGTDRVYTETDDPTEGGQEDG